MGTDPAALRAGLRPLAVVAMVTAAVSAAGVLGAVGANLFAVCLGLESAEPLLEFLYRDDAYYCFEWARSVVAGDGPRVGAGPATSGVHVLWELVLMAVAPWGRTAVEAAAAPLGLAAWVAGAVVLGRALGEAGGIGGAAVPRFARWFTTLALLGMPWVALEAANGQETGLAVLGLAGLLAAARAGQGVFTLAALAATLARSDLFLFVVALAWLRRGGGAGSGWGRAVAAPVVVLLVYGGLNLALAGHPLQDSAAPMPWLFRQRFLATDPGFGDWLGALWWWGRPALLGEPFARWSLAGSACLLAAILRPVALRSRALAALGLLALAAAAGLGVQDLAVPCVGIALALLPVRDPLLAPGARDGLALLGAGVGLVTLHSLVRWYPRDYYWVPLAVAGVWALGRTVAAGGPRAAGAVLVLAVATGVSAYELGPGGVFPRRQSEVAMDLAAHHLLEVAPGLAADPGARVGSFNCGHLAWRSGAEVVNLDGVVNREAFAALRAGALGAWLDDEGIGWLCDNPLQFGLDPTVPHACGAWFGGGFDPGRDLVEHARFVDPLPPPGRAGTDVVSLYRRGGPPPGAAPRLEWLEDPADAPDHRCLLWVGEVGQRLVREVEGETPPQRVADAVAGVPIVLGVPAPEPGQTAIFYVRGSDQPILRQYGPR